MLNWSWNTFNSIIKQPKFTDEGILCLQIRSKDCLYSVENIFFLDLGKI